MRREFSAGGVLVRRLRGRWHLAAIRPAGKPEGTWALPKGLIGPGEGPRRRPLREVAEETGAQGRLEGSSATCATSTRGRGERVFKVVSFYLLRYSSGRLGDLPPEHAHEVAEVRWLPLEEAPRAARLQGRAGHGREGARPAPRGSMIRPPVPARSR